MALYKFDFMLCYVMQRACHLSSSVRFTYLIDRCRFSLILRDLVYCTSVRSQDLVHIYDL